MILSVRDHYDKLLFCPFLLTLCLCEQLIGCLRTFLVTLGLIFYYFGVTLELLSGYLIVTFQLLYGYFKDDF